jgi:DNA-binding XRE family transcriptional regulator
MPDRPQRSPPIVDTATLFGRCVAVMRKDIGLSQGAFAEQLGISRPSLTHIETGRTPPTFFLLLKFGQHVGRQRLDRDATALLALLHMTATALRAEGIRVKNRPRRDTDEIVDAARIDRVVGRIYDGEFREVIPVRVVTFDGDDDDDDGPVRIVRPDSDAE